ncbi:MULTISPECIES: NAD-dependent epimerase/dehydratase family protein [Nocardiopsidaceae]|uniref:NAD-dependent epimerase/dehydratase family protein n=1 Tax=Streptomonospora nanhaiensis TaxID=1323731 RepID=A0ABY6YP06_9ACTN|nr:NAD-dependent epimerase/dehydratase family protein [Streptomonospora nanhaiensis]WAE74044.1 NAD-dependent epimerase/dehydratase family protein [Streptomonospora nanhaiensis]
MTREGRAVVTGGAGFIGAALVSALLHDGVPVAVVDRAPWQDAVRLHGLAGTGELTYHAADMRDIEQLEPLFSGTTHVYHLSANTENRSDRAGRTADFTDTVGGTIALLEALREAPRPVNVVMTSSQLVYGPVPEGTTVAEGSGLLRPTTRFAAGKAAAEAFLEAYANECGLQAAVGRLSNVVGPGMGRGIIADLVRRLHDDPGEIRLLGDGRQTRSYLHVRDCVAALRAVAAAAESDGGDFSVFHVCNQDAISAHRVAEIVAEEFPDGTPEITYEGGRQGWRGDIPSLLIRPEALEEHGWRPRSTSEEAVRETARALLATRRPTTGAR